MTVFRFTLFGRRFFKKNYAEKPRLRATSSIPGRGFFIFFWRASTYVFRLPFLNVLMLKNDIYGGEIKSLRTH